MKEQTHTRKGRILTDLAENKSVTWASISLAKKASRRIQMEQDGALGRGSIIAPSIQHAASGRIKVKRQRGRHRV